MITREMVEAVVVQHVQKGPTSGKIAEAIVKLEEIQRQRQRLEQDRQAIVKEMERRLKEADELIAILQKSCPHPAAKYQGDPAGGSDSCHSCDLCGKQW